MSIIPQQARYIVSMFPNCVEWRMTVSRDLSRFSFMEDEGAFELEPHRSNHQAKLEILPGGPRYHDTYGSFMHAFGLLRN